MSIRWDPRLAIGVKEIDLQHQEIFGRVGALLDGMKAGRAREELEALVAFLEEYVVHHFEAEEALMRSNAWGHVEAHVAEHQKFTADFRVFRARFASSGFTTGLVVDLATFVTGWLGRHIAGPDRAFGRSLAGRAGTVGSR